MTFPELSSRDVYLDTSIFVNVIVEGMAQSQVCYEAYEYLAVERRAVYISFLTRLEFLQAMRGLANKSLLPDEFRERFNLADWENVAVRQRWIEHWAYEFDDLLDGFGVVHELPYRHDVWLHLPRHMAAGPMGAYDAFHLATAISYRIPELWTTDSDFRRAEGINVRILRDS